MNLSISSSNSHCVNSLNSSRAQKFKTEDELEFLRSADSINLEVQLSLDSQSSPRELNQGITSALNNINEDHVTHQTNSDFQNVPQRKDQRRNTTSTSVDPARRISVKKKVPNFQFLKNTEDFFDVFRYKKTCSQRILCKKIGVVERLKQLKFREIEEKFCKKCYKQVMERRSDLKLEYDKYVNVLDLNILMILISEETEEFEYFLSCFGTHKLYFQIFTISKSVLEHFSTITSNSKLYKTLSPVEFFVKSVSGYFLNYFKFANERNTFFGQTNLNKLITSPDDFFTLV